MAFVKRTWLARIGTGLNKFIIGEKDANDKQTLVNSPDSVTQQGDVISADNLNDLEDRIEAEFTSQGTAIESKANVSYVNGMKLTKVWENPNPSSDFASQNIPLATEVVEVLVEVRPLKGYATTEIKHFKGYVGASSSYVVHDLGGVAGIVGNVLLAHGRSFGVRVYDGSTTIHFGDGYKMGANNGTPVGEYDNGVLIPVAVYKVGNIYNS